MHREVNCRIVLGNTELLLGNMRAMENDVLLRPKTGEIKFGDQGKWEKLAYNQKGHMVLALGPKLQMQQREEIGRNKQKRVTRRRNQVLRVSHANRVMATMEEKFEVLQCVTQDLQAIRESAKRETFLRPG